MLRHLTRSIVVPSAPTDGNRTVPAETLEGTGSSPATRRCGSGGQGKVTEALLPPVQRCGVPPVQNIEYVWFVVGLNT